ncbi:R3H domain-containing protein 2 [Mortierella sp. GBA35]|nr:R3H domain-containing protein 2 [Mortierella sp. GBA35]
MVATEGSLDKFLLTALQNRQDRLFLLKLEREYCNFIEDPSEDVLEFPWLNSYYRMMIHRSAIYFQLARKVDANQKKITLSKTEHSAM